MESTRGYLLVDANVLIDYLASDLSVLALASRHLGKVYVLSTVLDEVYGLDPTECERLELHIIEPDLETLAKAARTRSSLSLQDHLCLIVARNRSWTCVTNDGALRRECQEEGVPVIWGLEVMTELVRAGQLDPEDAISVAEAIHASNPFHIPRKLVNRFARLVRSLLDDHGL